jgi:hypothetical protein
MLAVVAVLAILTSVAVGIAASGKGRTQVAPSPRLDWHYESFDVGGMALCKDEPDSVQCLILPPGSVLMLPMKGPEEKEPRQDTAEREGK